jgi:glycine/serine hydroxymethyltransferase
MKEAEMKQIAAWVGRIVADPVSQKLQQKVREEVLAFTEKFSVP